jgi:hypothetical protein
LDSRPVGVTGEIDLTVGAQKVTVNAVNDCQEGAKGKEIGYLVVQVIEEDEQMVGDQTIVEADESEEPSPIPKFK